MAEDEVQEELSVQGDLATELVDRVEQLLLEAERLSRPVELDPYRSGLFELFVLADGAVYLSENAVDDLTSDAISRELAGRWNLADAARESIGQQAKLASPHL